MLSDVFYIDSCDCVFVLISMLS